MVDSPLKRTVYYDGLCQLCSREIDYFRTRVKDGSLAYVDISDPHFDAVSLGIDPVLVHRHMHVRDELTGRMQIGVDALAGMWECVPGFRWLARFVRLPIIRTFSNLGYTVFAWIRPKLPKRKRNQCDSGNCSLS